MKTKNKSAQNLASLRWNTKTPEEKKAVSLMMHEAKARKKAKKRGK